MARRIKDPGIGATSNAKAKRFVNQDGSFNIRHKNKRGGLSDAYAYLIAISWMRFFAYVFVGYILLNSIFALCYTLLGVEAITTPSGSVFRDFLRAFFFSAQTITTVGYGTMSPKGIIFGFISSFEAMIGLLSFSFITGLLYGRFSKPRANIRFSNVMVLRAYEDHDALMFRLMSSSASTMIQPRIEVTLTLTEKDQTGGYKNNFYRLSLERDKITYLPTTWTVVHRIREGSPFVGYDRQQLNTLKGELLIMTSYYEESFNQEVHQIHSYLLKNIKIDHAFQSAYYYDEEGYTVLDHELLDKTYKL